MSDSLQPQGLQPTGLLCPWDSLGKNTGVGCHALLQGIFLTQGSNSGLPHCKRILYHLSHQGSLSAGNAELEGVTNHQDDSWPNQDSRRYQKLECWAQTKMMISPALTLMTGPEVEGRAVRSWKLTDIWRHRSLAWRDVGGAGGGTDVCHVMRNKCLSWKWGRRVPNSRSQLRKGEGLLVAWTAQPGQRRVARERVQSREERNRGEGPHPEQTKGKSPLGQRLGLGPFQIKPEGHPSLWWVSRKRGVTQEAGWEVPERRVHGFTVGRGWGGRPFSRIPQGHLLLQMPGTERQPIQIREPRPTGPSPKVRSSEFQGKWNSEKQAQWPNTFRKRWIK